MIARRVSVAQRVAIVLAAILLPSLHATAASFKTDVLPVLQRECVACHMAGDEPGNLSLVPSKAFATLTAQRSTTADMALVAPGDVEKSYLLHKLDGTHLDAGGSGMRMPMGLPPLDAAAAGLFRDWIEAGAKDD